MDEPAASPPPEPGRRQLPPDAEPAGFSRGPLIALLLVVVLAVGGYLLAQHLRSANRIQDCVMAGRSNCSPVQ